MADSKDVCYNCELRTGVCAAPIKGQHGAEEKKKWEDCPKDCSVCKYHRCKERHKCPKIYPNRKPAKENKK